MPQLESLLVDLGWALADDAKSVELQPQIDADLAIHHSHRVLTRGIWSWCPRREACTRGMPFKLLRGPCQKATAWGVLLFRRFRLRRLPLHTTLQKWGDGDESETDELS